MAFELPRHASRELPLCGFSVVPGVAFPWVGNKGGWEGKRGRRSVASVRLGNEPTWLTICLAVSVHELSEQEWMCVFMVGRSDALHPLVLRSLNNKTLRDSKYEPSPNTIVDKT